MSTITLTYDGSPLTDVLWSTATFESQMGGIPGTFEFTVRDENQTHSFVTGKHISLSIDGQLYFGGIVTQVVRKFALPVDRTDSLPSVRSRQWVLRGVDYNIYFDKRVLLNTADPRTQIPALTGDPNDKQVITALFANYADISDTSIDYSTYVDHVGRPMGTDTTTYTWRTQGEAIRETFKDITQWSGALYYFDHSQKLHYIALETATPSWSFSDTPNKTTTFGFREVEFMEDGSNLVNDALIWGGTAWTSAGATATVNYGRYTNSTSLGARGRWQYGKTHFNEDGYASDANCAMHAKVVVEGDPGASGAGLNDDTRGLVNPQKQVRLAWFSDGTPTPLVPGSVVTTHLNTFGFSVALPVRYVRVSFVTPTVARFDGFFGILTDDPWTLWKYMRSIQATFSNTTAAATTPPPSDGTSPSAPGTTVSMTPLETPNGSTTTFTVTDAYSPSSIQVWMNGLLQLPGSEYTEHPTLGTFTFVDAPLTGDELWVTYISA